MPKIFISFLGKNKYNTCKYYYKADKSDALEQEVYFVQQDIARIFCSDWTAKDRFVVFTTDAAAQNNWYNRITHFDYKTKISTYEKGKGLQYELQQLGLNFKIKNQEIPDGKNEEEIWQIFSSIVNQIQEGDEIYLDITFSFRFIPLLCAELIDYARTVKNTTIKGIYYGNYEVAKDGYAPIMSLTNVINLQQWTSAAHAFSAFGVTDELEDLLDKYTGLKDLSDRLGEFTKAIYTCRGHELNTKIDIDLLKKVILKQKDKADNTFIAQLEPLLDVIEKKVKPFQNKTVLNGLSAVEWCIDHDLIQQGYTFLQETLKSYVIEKVFGRAVINDYRYRSLANYALSWAKKIEDVENDLLNTNKSKRYKQLPPIPNKAAELFNIANPMKQYYRRFTGGKGSRNDISHCGYNKYARSADALKKELKNVYKQIKKLQLT